MLERKSGHWLVVLVRSRTDDRSLNCERSEGGKHAEQEVESPQASQPPDLRERTTERIAKMTASRRINDMMMVGIIPCFPSLTVTAIPRYVLSLL
jgi:hypothetical protein